MPRFPKPAEGSWHQHFPNPPEPCRCPMRTPSRRSSTSSRVRPSSGGVAQRRPGGAAGAARELLHQGAGRCQDLGHRGAGQRREVRAFHNVCRHRGTSWFEAKPQTRRAGCAASSPASTTGGDTGSTGRSSFVQSESEFFDLDKADFGLVPVHCDVWEGFVFVNLADEPRQSLHDFLGPMVTGLDGYPFHRLTERYGYRHRDQLEALHGRLPGVLPRGDLALRSSSPAVPAAAAGRVRGARTTRSTARTGWSARPASTPGTCRRTWSSPSTH